jgi:hypothetical protein
MIRIAETARREEKMGRFTLLVAALLAMIIAANAEDTPGWMDWVKKHTPDIVPKLSMPAVSVPSMPDISMPDFSKMSEQMGYEVTTFRVQWGLPPKAKLRLRAKAATDPSLVQASFDAMTADAGILKKSLLSSAMTAKRIQNAMKFGTAIIDVDFAVPPKVRMSFVNGKTGITRGVEDLDLACGQAITGSWF